MRHIDNYNPNSLDREWTLEADQRKQKTLVLQQQQKFSALKKYVNKNSKTWQKIKPALGKLSNRKCWYCESKEDRSDMHLEHFRPKNNVYEAKKKLGKNRQYGYLAFDPANYRYACTFCNCRRTDQDAGITAGKHDRFPTKNDWWATQPNQISQEQPLLLDPLIKSHCLQIGFLASGIAIDAHSPNTPNPMVEASLDVYHLNHTWLIEARRELYRKIQSLVLKGNRLINDLSTNDIAEEWFAQICAELTQMLDKNSEYSSCALYHLKGYRNFLWVETILKNLHLV